MPPSPEAMAEEYKYRIDRETPHTWDIGSLGKGFLAGYERGKQDAEERIKNPHLLWNCQGHDTHDSECFDCRQMTREMTCGFCKTLSSIANDRRVELKSVKHELRRLRAENALLLKVAEAAEDWFNCKTDTPAKISEAMQAWKARK